MSYPVRLLEGREADRIAELCRVLGLDPVEDLRASDESVAVRAQPVLGRSARSGAATALLAPATRADADGLVDASVRLARALHRSGTRAAGLLPRTSCPAGVSGDGVGKSSEARDLGLDLLLDLGPSPSAGSGGAAWAGWSTALEVRLAVDREGIPALVGPGPCSLVGGSVLGEQLARRCVDWVLVPCGAGPLGVHHAVELRGRRLGGPPAAVVLVVAAGHISEDGLQAIRVARLHGLEVAVWFGSDTGEESRASAVEAGASIACAGRTAPTDLVDWLASVRAVGAGTGCFLGARDRPWEARLREVVERVLGRSLHAPLPEFPADAPRSAELFCDAEALDDPTRSAVVRQLRWLREVGVMLVQLGPGSGVDG